ncbi:rho guanine nucleotide exchange factor 8-like [Andrographis paniculata]|uniref:rho guanine nucleotide exchange factor 8-like n=1 Tax=Andrographis paniculata TaxID=175694 RepID=UPI0021E987A8|nr:rho guanine nucleotide exchange factor 8-like [Andrographis paniculata]
MVREEQLSVRKTRSFNLRKIFDRHNNLSPEKGKEEAARENKLQAARNDVVQQVSPVSLWPMDDDGGGCRSERRISDMEVMKEKFSKLLLGEDNSGGGKGVSSAQALSNAITNLAASVFGEQRRLEPMDPERKARWKKEIDWFLSVSNYIVEFVPCQQKSKDGSNMEVMTTQQRRDLRMNIPALRKLDRMLLEILDNFTEEQEFKYVSRDADKSKEGGQSNDKWWLPRVKVPVGGLSEESRQFLLKQKEGTIQVLKTSMAINGQILSDMDVPYNYIESLPKNGRESLGDLIYRSITDECFDPMEFLSGVDFSSEHKVVDLKNRIEASIVIWKRKMHHKEGKSSWIGFERREIFEERAETILLLIKQQFPGISQSSLEICKIQYNRDVGLAIMESYSRVLETLASTVLSRIQDVLNADALAGDRLLARQKSGDLSPSPTLSDISSSASSGSERCSSAAGTPSSSKTPTLLDFIGWDLEIPQEVNKKEKMVTKPANINTNKKVSYLEKIEMSMLTSPTARH